MSSAPPCSCAVLRARASAAWAAYPGVSACPQDIRQTCADTGAAGICVHHWVVSDQLVEEAHNLGLHVNTWTVNNPFAARMAADAGVDSITTDRVDLVRLALRSHLQPGPGTGSAGGLREAARIAPR